MRICSIQTGENSLDRCIDRFTYTQGFGTQKMTLDELQTLWSEDAKIDVHTMGDASINIPSLQQKYLTLLANERILYKRLLLKREKLELQLEDYFEGKIDGKDIGRAPYQHIPGMKESMRKRVSTDDEMIKMNLAIIIAEEKMLYLKEIVRDINQRNWYIKNWLDYQKWTNGSSLT